MAYTKTNWVNDVTPANATNMNNIEEGIEAAHNMIYPIGSIYMSVNNTNPSTLFGGTWEQIKDRFLLACGTSYTAGATGGEATHKLTINEMPSHSHGLKYDNIGASGTARSVIAKAGDKTSIGCITNTGGGTAHNNMPPYLAVYVWKRTA